MGQLFSHYFLPMTELVAKFTQIHPFYMSNDLKKFHILKFQISLKALLQLLTQILERVGPSKNVIAWLHENNIFACTQIPRH